MQIKEGDVFRWRYREPGDDRSYGRYHCCSLIAVMKDGRLSDTYWGGRSDDRSFGPDELPLIELTHLGNFSDLERAGEWMADYYEAADIVDLNHANSSRNNFYLRKGAKRSATKMLEMARHKLERSESEEKTAARRASDYRAAIAKIEAGEIDDVHL